MRVMQQPHNRFIVVIVIRSACLPSSLIVLVIACTA